MVVRICGLLPLLLLVVWSELACGQEAGPMRLRSALQALDVSELAAQNGLEELSLRAVREALQYGPPVNEADPGDVSGSIDAIERRQAKLDVLWHQQSFSAQQVYETLAAVVLPDAIPTAVHFYSRPSHADERLLPSDHSILRRLLLWAQQCDQLDDLRLRVNNRLADGSESVVAHLLQARIAILTESQDEVEQCLQRLQTLPATRFHDTDLREVLKIAVQARHANTDSQDYLALIEIVTDRVLENAWQAKSVAMVDGQIEPASTMLLVSAQLALQHNRVALTSQRLQAYLELNQSRTSRYSGRLNGQYRRIQLQTAAGIWLKAGRLSQAIDVLQAAVGNSAIVNSIDRMRMTQSLVGQLSQLPAVERYEQLRRICIPADENEPLSIMTAPRADRRNIKQMLLGTGQQLLITAKELNQLPQLIDELEARDAAKSLHARILLAVAYCLTDQLHLATPLIEHHVEAIGYDLRTKQKARDSLTDLWLLETVSQQPALANLAEQLAREILKYNGSVGTPLVTEIAYSLQRNARLSSPDSQLSPQQSIPWISANTTSFAMRDAGASNTIWTSHRGVMAHHGGSGTSCLYLPFPLIDEFEFSVETLAAPGQVSAIGYGGVVVESHSANDSIIVADVGRQHSHNRWIASARKADFNNTQLRLHLGHSQFLVNGGPTFQDDEQAAASSPWVLLTAQSNQRGIWRFPLLTGNPKIPRQVRLTDDRRLRGWNCVAFGESRITPWGAEAIDNAEAAPPPHWSWLDGTIVGRQESDDQGLTLRSYLRKNLLDQTSPRLLQYDRPLVSGDSIRWEFQYQQHTTNIAPVLGRTAFLVEADQIQTLSLSSDDGWADADTDTTNVTTIQQTEIAGPFVKSGWNTASLHVRENRLELHVNDRLVLQRPLAADTAAQFGFYHDSRRHTAIVRNVVLKGDWPEKVPANLFRQQAANVAHQNPRMAVIAADAFLKNPASIVQYANSLPPEQRFRYLHDLAFLDDEGGLREIRAEVRFRVDNDEESSTELVSPLVQLLKTAHQIDRLSELQSHVEKMPAANSEQMRLQSHVLALIAIENHDLKAAARYLDDAAQDTAIRPATDHRSGFAEDWSPVLVAQASLPFESLWPTSRRLLSSSAGGLSSRSRYGRYLVGELEQRMNETQPVLPPHWRSIIHSTAATHGAGFPTDRWTQTNEGTVQHWPGGDDNRLFLSVPLTGDFIFEAEVAVAEFEAIELGYHGTSFSFPLDNRRQIFSRRFGKRPRRHWQSTALDFRDRVRCRVQVTGDLLTAYANQTEVFTTQLPASRDPWLFLRAGPMSMGATGKLRLDAATSIPQTYTLDTSPALNGWSADYYGDSTGVGKVWSSSGSVIMADRQPAAGYFVESVLRYHRPLWGNCRMDYEFFFRSDQQLVHPVVGRTVFLLDNAAAVEEHELSDGRFETGKFAADARNLHAERNRSERLPLKEGTWNRASLVIHNNEFTLLLNDIPVYVTSLSARNDRIFGLFHYKEQTSVQARNVRLTGDWPTQIPSPLSNTR